MAKRSSAMYQNDFFMRMFYLWGKTVDYLLFETAFFRFICDDATAKFYDKHTLPAWD